MIERISNMILLKLKQDDAVDEKIEEAYIYGIQILIINFIGIIVSIVIGLLFSALLETMIFLLSFVFTRRYCGGYHTNALWKCLLTTAGMITAVLIFDKYLTLSLPVCTFVFIISIIVFLFFVPIENTNKPLSNALKKRNKKISLIILIFQCLIGFILLLLGVKFYNIIFITVALISFFIVISVLKEGGGEMKKVSKIIAKATLKAAANAVSKSSDWILFQTKEPKNLNKMLKK